MKKIAIAASGLCFSYEKTHVLQEAQFQVTRGEFIGVIGPNGGGKTTLLKLIMGFLSPTKGTLHVFDTLPKLARQKIGYVPQASHTDRAFPITVLELVRLGSVGNFWGHPKGSKETAEHLLEELGLAEHRHKAFSSLSGGLAQKALLARALLSDPDILLLDEPTANIDAAARISICDQLERLKQKKTILLVTHDLRTIVERVDRILCVHTTATSYLPSEICEHFALGLYHAPLIPLRLSDGLPVSL